MKILWLYERLSTVRTSAFQCMIDNNPWKHLNSIKGISSSTGKSAGSEEGKSKYVPVRSFGIYWVSVVCRYISWYGNKVEFRAVEWFSDMKAINRLYIWPQLGCSYGKRSSEMRIEIICLSPSVGYLLYCSWGTLLILGLLKQYSERTVFVTVFFIGRRPTWFFLW